MVSLQKLPQIKYIRKVYILFYRFSHDSGIQKAHGTKYKTFFFDSCQVMWTSLQRKWLCSIGKEIIAFYMFSLGIYFIKHHIL